MIKKLILAIVLIVSMSSKNDDSIVVCVSGNADLVVCGTNTKNEAVITDNEVMAIKFPNTFAAQQFINDLNNTTVGFFGTRPTRPK